MGSKSTQNHTKWSSQSRQRFLHRFWSLLAPNWDSPNRKKQARTAGRPIFFKNRLSMSALLFSYILEPTCLHFPSPNPSKSEISTPEAPSYSSILASILVRFCFEVGAILDPKLGLCWRQCCMPRLFDMPARIAQTSIYLTTNTFPHSTARLYDTKTQEVRSLRFIPNPCAWICTGQH